MLKITIKGFRVSMGVEVGTPNLFCHPDTLEYLYVGDSVSKAEKLCECAHGGQILVTQEVMGHMFPELALQGEALHGSIALTALAAAYDIQDPPVAPSFAQDLLPAPVPSAFAEDEDVPDAPDSGNDAMDMSGKKGVGMGKAGLQPHCKRCIAGLCHGCDDTFSALRSSAKQVEAREAEAPSVHAQQLSQHTPYIPHQVCACMYTPY